MPRRVVDHDRRHAGRRVSVGVATVLTLALATACTVGPSQRPSLVIEGSAPPGTSSTPSSGAKPVPPLEHSRDGAIDWSDCTPDTVTRLGAPAPPASMSFQCARVLGPLDSPSDPGHGTSRVSLLKVGTGATPLLVVNDLGGLPGTLYAARLAAQLPASFRTTFSLIGMDRRGTAGSDGVHCVPQADRDQIVGYDTTSTDLTALLDATRDASQQCILDLDTRTAALDVWRTAEDLETVRQQLGVPHLNAIGHGDGSRVLTVYADRYPDQVGRLVLDGSTDPAASGTDAAQAKAGAAETTFAAFAADCVSRGCPLGPDPKTALSQLLGTLHAQPLSTAGGVQVTNGTALWAVLAGLSDRTRWPELANAIAAARVGNGDGLAALVAPVLSGTPVDPARLDADLVSGCNDQSDRLAPGQVSGMVRDWSTRDPLFGGLFAQHLLLCGPWPVPSQQLPKPTAPGTPPIVVFSTATDPVTPELGTERTAQQLDSGVLVSWQGTGHGALGQSSCATTAAARFLVDGQVPQNLTTCPP